MKTEIVKMIKPSDEGEEQTELHHITEADAVIFYEKNGEDTVKATTVAEALNRSRIVLDEEQPEGPCIWAAPVKS